MPMKTVECPRCHTRHDVRVISTRKGARGPQGGGQWNEQECANLKCAVVFWFDSDPQSVATSLNPPTA